jgi:hypothetical protein
VAHPFAWISRAAYESTPVILKRPELSWPADLTRWMIPSTTDRHREMAERAWTLLVAARSCEAAFCKALWVSGEREDMAATWSNLFARQL